MDALASGSWLSRERVTAVATISGVCGAAMLLGLWLLGHGTLDPFGKPIGADFTAFWNAGHLADTGAPAAAWNQQLLNDTIRHTHSVEYGTAWIYPPVFLLVAAPLGAMPYLPALLVWQLLSLTCAALLLQAILESRRDTLVALASPLSALVLANGQNSLITAALLGGGLLLAARRPWLGGALLGALIYKPQLGIVIVPLLLFTRNWRAFAGAAVAAVALIASSVMLWGADCWPAWLASLRYGRFYMEHGSVGLYKSASLFSMARTWGVGAGAAYAVQSLGILVSVGGIWMMRSSTNFTRAAAVCAAAALSTPYLLDYDMAVVGLGGAFLYAEARKDGFLPYERSILALIWFAPWISRPVAEYALLPLGPIAAALLMWLAWRRASGHRHPTVDMERLPGDVAGLAAR